MKAVSLVILFLSVCALGSISAQGIDFQSDTLSWQAVLSKAKKVNLYGEGFGTTEPLGRSRCRLLLVLDRR